MFCVTRVYTVYNSFLTLALINIKLKWSHYLKPNSLKLVLELSFTAHDTILTFHVMSKHSQEVLRCVCFPHCNRGHVSTEFLNLWL